MNNKARIEPSNNERDNQYISESSLNQAWLSMNNTARIELSNDERDNQYISESSLNQACLSMKKYGFTIIDNVFTKDYINNLNSVYKERFNDASNQDNEGSDGKPLELGDGRKMHPVEIAGEFLDPLLYRNYAYMQCSTALMGNQDIILGSFGSVVSMPGAKAQAPHCDAPDLFPEQLALNDALPPYAITISIPLVEITQDVGGTEVCVGSHKNLYTRFHACMSNTEFFMNEYPKLGGCLLWDYRTAHFGQANLSNIMRPLLYLVYSRKWFRDPNFSSHRPLNISPENLAKLSEKDRSLFHLATYLG